MILAIQNKYQNYSFNNIASIRYEYQKNNGKHGSYWLTLIFYKNSPEAKEFKYGDCSIEIDPKIDTFQIYRESK